MCVASALLGVRHSGAVGALLPLLRARAGEVERGRLAVGTRGGSATRLGERERCPRMKVVETGEVLE